MAAATTAGVPTPVLASEHHALTRGCASLDRSERGKLVLSGAGAVEFLNRPVTNALAVRTEHGVDLICDAADTERLHAALRGRGATEVSVAAAECLRVERGRPRYGVDMDDTTIPQEAGLNARAVSFTKGCYVGQETVARLHYKGKPNRHLRGLRLSAPACTGDQLQLGERAVGRVS